MTPLAIAATASMVAGSFSYDNGNRLLSDARFTYTYDNEGDLTSKRDKTTAATTTYAWNMRHQLTSITFPDGSVTSYRYDPLGHRIEINAAGVVTRQVYDGQNLRLQYNASNALTGSFVDAAVDGHLETTQAGQRLFYEQDGSNSTVQLTNSSGTAVASYAYDSFGNPAGANSTSPSNPFTYTGREFDAKSGLYYYRSRYYAPDQGRFLSEDPIAHLNAYTYTQNDPVDFADPSGALLTEYAVLTASTQRMNTALCISGVVGTLATTAAAGIGAGFDQSGAAGDQARSALFAGTATTILTCLLAAVPADVAEGGAPEFGGVSRFRSLGAASTDDPAIGPAFRGDIQLFGGRSGSNVKNLVGPPNSVVRGSNGRIFRTDGQGNVIADITRDRVKPVVPGIGFGPKRPPTQEELNWIDALWPSP